MTSLGIHDPVRYRTLDAVAIITLNRPGALNALDGGAISALLAAFDRAEADPAVRAIVLCGDGRAFCSGFDLNDSSSDPGELARELHRDLEAIMRVWDCSKPTVAAVHGYCLGGGLELAVAADLTIASDGCFLGEPELQFGSGIVALLLPWLIGVKAAKQIILCGEDRVSAVEAHRLGLVNQVVPDGRHVVAALAAARRLAAIDANALRLQKRAIHRALDVAGFQQAMTDALATDIEIENTVTPESTEFNSVLNAEGVRAALAWRRARYAPHRMEANMKFPALLLHEHGGTVTSELTQLDAERLPDAPVLVRVDHSSLNYKDGMVLRGEGRLVRTYPHVPGVDLAGTVESSDDERFAPGDRVVLTGWRVGEAWWGGYAGYARVKPEWLVKLPDSLSTHQAMAIGTAGFTAMLAVLTLEEAGLVAGSGAVLVTGASGGVGSMAVHLLARRDHEVVASTGRSEHADYLRGLGCADVIDRNEIADNPNRPLLSERWIAAVDSVGGDTLAHVLAEMRYGGSVAACGLAGGNQLNATVLPFLLRGVNLLGIDSVMCPTPLRERVWQELAVTLDIDALDTMTDEATLADVPRLAGEILAGHVRGRTVINIWP